MPQVRTGARFGFVFCMFYIIAVGCAFSGCNTVMSDPCIEDVTVSIRNEASRDVHFRLLPPERRDHEVIETLLPPGGSFKEYLHSVLLGDGPVIVASLSPSFVPAIDLKIDWSTGEVAIVEGENGLRFRVQSSGRSHP